MNAPKLRFKGFTEDWQNNKVEDHYTNISTNSFSRSCLNYENGKVKNIHYGDIHTKLQSHVDASIVTIPYINENENYSRYLEVSFCKEKDLIFADASEDLNDIGKCVEIINTNDEKILSGLHTIHLRNYTDFFFSGFGGYLFRTDKIVKQIQKESQGAKVLGISSRKILNLEINIPNVQEQEKIASFFTAIDQKLNLLKEKKEKLELYKKGIMQQIFSQKLRFKDEKGNEFPEWEEKRLGEICEYKNGGSFEKYVCEDGLYNLISLNSIDINGKIKSNHKKTSITDGSLQKGDLIMVLSDVAYGNFLGLTDIVPGDNFVLNQRMAALKLKISVDRFYLKTFINRNQSYFKLMGQGSSQLNLSKGDVENFIIKLPSLTEQQKIADFLSALDTKINLVSTQIEKTELWKKGLLQQMFV